MTRRRGRNESSSSNEPVIYHPPPASPGGIATFGSDAAADDGSQWTRVPVTTTPQIVWTDDSQVDQTLRTLSLHQLKGADHVEELGRQLRNWRLAFTSEQPRPRYTLNRQLGEGSQGIIFSIIDQDCRREVALKTLHQVGCDTSEISRFIHEAQITAQLEHPGIVPVHDFGVLPDGTVFYTMKRIEGESLAAYLSKRAAKVEHRFDLLEMFLRVCETVGFAHSRGVVHRDLKPRNVMVGSFGEVLVMDWGLAKVIGSSAWNTRVTSMRSDPHASVDAHRTLDGMAVGTPAYMSPEQARGESENVDQRSDIYSLGVILYEMLSGTSPYQRGDVRRTLEQVASGTVLRLDELNLNDEIPRSLVSIVHKAMAFKIAERYETVEDLSRDLRSYLAGQAVSAHDENPFETMVRTYRRHRTSVNASAIVAGMSLVLVIGGWWLRKIQLEQTVREYRADAARMELKQDLDTARGIYERILAYYPDDHSARVNLDRLRGAMDKQKEQDLQQRKLDDAKNLIARAQRAEQTGEKSDLEEAQRLYLQAMGLNPGDDELSSRFNAVVNRLAYLQQRAVIDQKSQSVAQTAQELLQKAKDAAGAGAYDAAIGYVKSSLELQRLPEGSELLAQYESEQKKAREREARREAEHRAEEMRANAIKCMDEAATQQKRLVELSSSIALKNNQMLVNSSADLRKEIYGLELQAKTFKNMRQKNITEANDWLHQANAIAPGYPPVRRALTRYYIDRLTEAEAQGNAAEIDDAEIKAKQFDDDKSYAKALSGNTFLTTDAATTLVMLKPIIATPDLVDVPSGNPIVIEAGATREVLRGRYMATNSTGVMKAYRFERGQDYLISLPTPPELPVGMRYIPAGKVYDRDGNAIAEVSAFALAQFEVTCGEYLKFLNDPIIHARFDAAQLEGRLILAPRETPDASSPLWTQHGETKLGSGEFVLELRANGSGAIEAIDPRCPVGGISCEDAAAYISWRSARDRIAWRLPSEREWQLALQGGDGRAYPWGQHLDPSLCHSALTAGNRPGRAVPGGTFFQDRSVQDAHDLAGSLSEFVDGDLIDHRLCIVMGGNLNDRLPEYFSAWSHREVPSDQALIGFGFRLALSLSDLR